MAELLRIHKPEADVRPPPQWQAFLELGFRPLYLAGTLWAVLSVALWVYSPQWLTGVLSGVFWHAHETLWGFVATIAVGFLLTAGATWTGINPLRGGALAALALLWIAARVGFLIPGATAFGAAALCELLFFAWAAVALGRTIYRTRSRRNYAVPVLVLGLGVADGLYLWTALTGDYAQLMPRFALGLLCMAVIALLVSRRVIPFFAMRAVPGLSIPMHTRSGHWQLAAGVLAIVLMLLQWQPGVAITLTIVSCLTLWQLFSWRPWAVRHIPLLWILYIGYAALGIGLLVAAAQAAGWIFRAAWAVHTIAVAGFSVLIIGMVTRTALGHLGRPLCTDGSMVAAYLLVILAAALRLAALAPGNLSLSLLHASAGMWISGFAIYLWRFFPLLIRPRADRPAAAVAKPLTTT